MQTRCTYCPVINENQELSERIEKLEKRLEAARIGFEVTDNYHKVTKEKKKFSDTD